jgi:hypothetical protein
MDAVAGRRAGGSLYRQVEDSAISLPDSQGEIDTI